MKKSQYNNSGVRGIKPSTIFYDEIVELTRKYTSEQIRQMFDIVKPKLKKSHQKIILK